ncbi:MAG: sugar phosphate nucleotidyltransferase [Nitrosotalea sp.]
MIDTVIIPAAGLGTRLLTATKESPKEMVPIFYKTSSGTLLVKPLLEIIFENLFDVGFRNFCIIVGRGKEEIENHLSPHYDFIDLLRKKGDHEYSNILVQFYKKIEQASIVWIRQYVPNGIGAATLLTEEVVGKKPFVFHAGDLYIPKTKYLTDMIKAHTKEKPTATIGVIQRKNPKQYGVATLKEVSKDVFRVTNSVEKPKHPKSNFALTGVNIFESDIFDAIRHTKPSVLSEIQLTDSIETLIRTEHKVIASKMGPRDVCLDIGTPKNYFSALVHSYGKKGKVTTR